MLYWVWYEHTDESKECEYILWKILSKISWSVFPWWHSCGDGSLKDFVFYILQPYWNLHICFVCSHVYLLRRNKAEALQVVRLGAAGRWCWLRWGNPIRCLHSGIACNPGLFSAMSNWCCTSRRKLRIQLLYVSITLDEPIWQNAKK